MTPYQRIMRAANSGKGVRLSNEECIALAGDTAISERATKYLHRLYTKDTPKENLDKAIWYLERLRKEIESGTP